MTETISTLLVMEKNLRGRLNELSSLSSGSLMRTRWGDTDRIEEPVYDAKKIDKKCSEIRRALFKIDRRIKEVNAFTKVDVEVDYDFLMEAID